MRGARGVLSRELKRKLDYRPGIYKVIGAYAQITLAWEQSVNIRATIITITAWREPKSFRARD